MPDAVYIDPDTDKKIVGRPAIEKYFAEFFKDIKGGKLTVEVESMVRQILERLASKAVVNEPAESELLRNSFFEPEITIGKPDCSPVIGSGSA